VCEIKEYEFLWCDYNIYIYCIYAYFIISSPYLLVFGDDHVRGAHEQMMLQVDLVRYKVRAGLDGDKEFLRVLMFYDLDQFCKLVLLDFDFCNGVIFMILEFIIQRIKVLNFPYFWEMAF